MSGASARGVAREALTRVRERAAYAHETMSALLDGAGLDERDGAFASRLGFGAISCRGTLEEALTEHINDLGRVDPAVMDCLVVSAYELLFMRTPARAAVSEGVELVRQVRPKAAGFANAVLRRLSERASTFPWGDPATDIAALARLHGHPAWMAERFVEEYGRERAESVMASNNEPAPLFLAIMPFKRASEDVFAELDAEGSEPVHEGPEGCVRCGNASRVVKGRVLADGEAIVTDGAAQTAAACVPLNADDSVVDLGAGRGTKTLLLTARARRAGFDVSMTAIDSHGFKLDRLVEAVRRVGAPDVRTIVADATDAAADSMPAAGTVDAVLVDAPCSGLGTLRRHPDRRWRATPEEIGQMAALGTALLRTAAFLVKPGGFVVYSTCTIVRDENDGVIETFLASDEGSGFRNDPLGECVPDEWRRFVATTGRFQSLPEAGGPDGHFIARLVRQG